MPQRLTRFLALAGVEARDASGLGRDYPPNDLVPHMATTPRACAGRRQPRSKSFCLLNMRAELLDDEHPGAST